MSNKFSINELEPPRTWTPIDFPYRKADGTIEGNKKHLHTYFCDECDYSTTNRYDFEKKHMNKEKQFQVIVMEGNARSNTFTTKIPQIMSKSQLYSLINDKTEHSAIVSRQKFGSGWLYTADNQGLAPDVAIYHGELTEEALLKLDKEKEAPKVERKLLEQVEVSSN